MSTQLKIVSGTRSTHAKRLCDTCDNGVVRRGAAESDEHIYCTFVRGEVRTRVVECNRYEDRAQAPLWALKQIAWVLRIDSKRQPVGFVRAIEWERQHKDEELLPPYIE